MHAEQSKNMMGQIFFGAVLNTVTDITQTASLLVIHECGADSVSRQHLNIFTLNTKSVNYQIVSTTTTESLFSPPPLAWIHRVLSPHPHVSCVVLIG